jgi:hypothetical protein
VVLTVASGRAASAPAANVRDLTGTLAVTSAAVPFEPLQGSGQGCFTLHLVDTATGAPVRQAIVDFDIHLADPYVPFAPSVSVQGSTDANGNGTYCYYAPRPGTWRISLNSNVTAGQDDFGNATSNAVTQTWLLGSPAPAPPSPKVQMDTVATIAADNAKVGDSVAVHYAITNDGTIEPGQYAFSPRFIGPAAVVSVTSPDATCTLSADGWLCDFQARLLPGASVSVDLVLHVVGPGMIMGHAAWVARPYASPLWAYFFSGGGDVALTTTARSSDLAIAAINAPRHMRVGARWAARIEIRNLGPDEALPTPLSLSLHGFRLVAIQGKDVTCTPGLRRCMLPKIAAGSSTVLTLSLVAPTPGTDGLTAVVGHGDWDTSLENNKTTAATAVVPRHR